MGKVGTLWAVSGQFQTYFLVTAFRISCMHDFHFALTVAWQGGGMQWDTAQLHCSMHPMTAWSQCHM